jgi:hypothetical protein
VKKSGARLGQEELRWWFLWCTSCFRKEKSGVDVGAKAIDSVGQGVGGLVALGFVHQGDVVA